MFLFCLHHAGGSSVSFAKWHQNIDKSINLHMYELPGHMTRASEEICTDFNTVISDLSDFIVNRINNTREPYMVYGHSLGALLAYYLYFSLLEKNIRPPVHIIFASRWPPYVHKSIDEIDLGDTNQFKKIALSVGHIDERICQNEKIFEYYVNLLRCDFLLMQNCPFETTPRKIYSDITVLWGDQDNEVKYEDVVRWKEAAGNKLLFHKVKGNHLFHMEKPVETTEIVNQKALSYQY